MKGEFMTDQDHVAENIRRMAGLHDRSLGDVATWIGLSRAGMMKLVVRDAAKRSYPKAETAMKLADAFGVTLNDLYAEPPEALQAAVTAWIEGNAPIEKDENVTPIKRRRVSPKAVRSKAAK
jgi:DNA-binding XRE family transcriptional regulator